jgi:RNA 2',3'-cyclic 3'-phosphodiesterase
MKKRVFIAVNLPLKIKEKLSSLRWDLPASWTKKDNLHITLAFLGNVSQEETLLWKERIINLTKERKPFFLEIQRITYAPLGAKIPRMIWALTNDSQEIKELAQGLSNHDLIGHITLARIREWDLRKKDPEEIPLIDESVSWKFKVDSIEIMESKINSCYSVIESFPFLK